MPGRTVVGVLVVLVAASVSGAGAQEQWRPVAVRLPDGISALDVQTCVTTEGVGGLRPSAIIPGQVDAQCSLAAVVQCSIPGAEPIDIDLDALCRGGMTRVTRAPRSVIPSWPGTDPLVIEWREWGDVSSRLLAQRTVVPSPGLRLPLAAGARLLRVMRTGSSPVTVVVPDAGGAPVDLDVSIPAAVDGGELLVRLDERARLVSTMTVQGAETVVVGVQGEAVLSLPGLASGAYLVFLGTPDTPLGPPMRVQVFDERTTEAMLGLPEASIERRITGVVTLNGEPVRQRVLDVLHLDTDQVATVTTDDRGEYTLTVAEPGTYRVRLVAEPDFGHLEAQRDVDVGDTRIDLALSGAPVRVSFLVRGGLPEVPVTVLFDGQRAFSHTAADAREPLDLVAIPPGVYQVSATADPDLVSDVVPLVVQPSVDAMLLTLDLREQRATLRVDGEGGRVAGVRARAGARILQVTADGTGFDIRRVPAGMPILIRAPGHVPACVVTGPDGEHVVSLVSSVAPLQLVTTGEVYRVPPGDVRLASADGCTVPLAEFEHQRTEDGFTILNLPSGVPVALELAGRSIPLLAPGAPVAIGR